MNRNVVYLAEYSIWSVLLEKVYRSKIDDVDELKTRLIHEWAQFYQSIADADISHSVVLSVYPGHTSSIIANNIWIELLFKLIILLNKPYFVYCVLIKSLESLLQTNNYSVM